MNNHFPKSLKRAAAMLMTLLMLVSQVVAPVAALAAVDVSTLPVISVNYTDWDGNPQSVTVYPSLSGEQAVYWAQMPDNINWDAGVTLLAQTMDGSYCPLDGTVPYYAVNAPGLDGTVCVPADAPRYPDMDVLIITPFYEDDIYGHVSTRTDADIVRLDELLKELNCACAGC